MGRSDAASVIADIALDLAKKSKYAKKEG
jgi:hypothetical protein